MTKHFSVYWLPVVVWGVVIFTVSSISSFPEEIQPLFSFDGLAHLGEFAIFSFLLARAFNNSNKNSFRKNFRVLAIVCAILYGVSDELHQYLVPLRTPSIIDLIYDCLGALIGQWFFKD